MFQVVDVDEVFLCESLTKLMKLNLSKLGY
jgi:hypothetical protein